MRLRTIRSVNVRADKEAPRHCLRPHDPQVPQTSGMFGVAQTQIGRLTGTRSFGKPGVPGDGPQSQPRRVENPRRDPSDLAYARVAALQPAALCCFSIGARWARPRATFVACAWADLAQ
jgi:hypothetical protein